MSAEAVVSTMKKVVKDKQSAKPSEHPPVANMVEAAIAGLKDKKGSSLAAIKKYVLANYKGIDMVRVSPFIRRYLKKAVAEGGIIQNKASFKMGAKPKVEKPKKTTAVMKPAAKTDSSKASSAIDAKKSAKAEKTDAKKAKTPTEKRVAKKAKTSTKKTDAKKAKTSTEKTDAKKAKTSTKKTDGEKSKAPTKKSDVTKPAKKTTKKPAGDNKVANKKSAAKTTKKTAVKKPTKK